MPAMSEQTSLAAVLQNAGALVAQEREHAEDLAARVAAAVAREMVGYKGSIPIDVEVSASSNGTCARAAPRFPRWLEVQPRFSLSLSPSQEVVRMGEESIRVWGEIEDAFSELSKVEVGNE